MTEVLVSYANFQNVQIVKPLESAEEELKVIGDRFQFRQELINIGKNGIEAMPNGGALCFRMNKGNDTVVITITDTGVGMNEEQLRRLGTPYYSTKEKGSGLGSMVSFSIIRQMNGKIDVKSERGKGTTHTITLARVP